jgi:dUTP pyrophosphatase
MHSDQARVCFKGDVRPATEEETTGLPPIGPDMMYVRCTSCQEFFAREKGNLREHHCNRHLVYEEPVFNCRLECRILRTSAKLPHRSRTTDAGYDLYTTENGTIPPHGQADFGTGLSITAPPGYYYTIDGRSGLFKKKGIDPYRGIIDSTYNGELLVVLRNNTEEPYNVQVGERIAQLILHRQIDADIVVVEENSPEYSGRGEKGFSSSGK